MNRNIKNLFRRETSTIKDFDNFDELFLVFSQLVEMDIEVPGVEGLSERLLYALSMISSEKLDRNDIITFFPIVWGKFEAFVRKCVFICDREKYEILIDNRKNTLPTFLDACGVKLNSKAKQYKKTPVTLTYEIRNTDTHLCENWSNYQWYTNLAQTLTAYLVVTDSIIPQLKKVKESTPMLAKFILEYHKQIITNDPWVYRFEAFLRVSDFNAKPTIISEKRGHLVPSDYDMVHFSRWIKRKSGEIMPFDADFSPSTKKSVALINNIRIEYEQNGKFIKKKTYYDLLENTPDYTNYDEENKKAVIPIRTYEYSEEGYLLAVVHFRYRREVGINVAEELTIDYGIDGGLTISDCYYTHPHTSSELTNYRAKPLIKKVREYDSRGRIQIKYDELYVEDGKWARKNQLTYVYKEDGLLGKIMSSHGQIMEIEYLGDEAVYIKKGENDKISKIIKKVKYKDGRVSKITFFDDEIDDWSNTIPTDVWTVDYE